MKYSVVDDEYDEGDKCNGEEDIEEELNDDQLSI